MRILPINLSTKRDSISLGIRKELGDGDLQTWELPTGPSYKEFRLIGKETGGEGNWIELLRVGRGTATYPEGGFNNISVYSARGAYRIAEPISEFAA